MPPQLSPGLNPAARQQLGLRRVNTAPEALTPSAMDFIDSLRPPGLVYKSREFTKRLFKSRCVANAISASGQFFGWFSNDGYEIYELGAEERHIVCTGKIKRRQYWFEQAKPELIHVDQDMKAGFSCAALSDLHIAIGANDSVLIFAIQGESPGRWLSTACMKESQIEKLTFSPKGDELVALFRTKDEDGKSCHKAIIYSTSEFAADSRHSDGKAKALEGFYAAKLKYSVCDIVDAAFSNGGDRIAVATDHNSNSISHIHLIRRNQQMVWRKDGPPLPLKVLDRRDASRGLIGVSLYDPVSASANCDSFGKDKELVCGLHTSFKEADDWHSIETTGGNVSLVPRGPAVASNNTRSQILAITVSSQYNAVALASPGTNSGQFFLEFKQQCYSPLSLVLNSIMTSFGCKLIRPISLSFTKCGTRLILLTGNVSFFQIHS